MSDDMIKSNKVKINATVGKKTRDKAEEFSKTDEYGSFSNFVETALIYYMGSLDKERELKLIEAEERLRIKEKEENNLVSIVLQLISNHPELLPEYNELRKKRPIDIDNTKKVSFE